MMSHHHQQKRDVQIKSNTHHTKVYSASHNTYMNIHDRRLSGVAAFLFCFMADYTLAKHRQTNKYIKATYIQN